MGERLDEWKRVKNGEAKIALGTRSAVFAPFDNLGLVIMDEEQEGTYKSEMSPRYHAKDVAAFRVGCHNGHFASCLGNPLAYDICGGKERYLFFECTLKTGTVTQFCPKL